MADNVTLPATGTVVATDDDGVAQHQYVKLEWGADNTFNKVSTGANALPVQGTVVLSATQTEDAAYTVAAPMAIIGGVRRDTDVGSPVSADGDVHPFTFNSRGRLRVAAMPGLYTATTGAITANGQSVSASVDSASNVMIQMTSAVTLSGHNATFEASIDGGTTWFTIQVVRSNGNTIETTTGVLAAAPVYAWEASVNGCTNVRVRATAHTAGTANYRILPGAYATEPIPAAQVSATQPVSGSVTVSGTATNTPATPTTLFVNSAATTNGTVVKATAGTVYGVTVSNSGASPRYVKLYNSTTVTVGTTTPTLAITVYAGDSTRVEFGPLGARHTTGICLAITGAAADADTTAIGAGEVKVVLSYI